MIEINKPLTEQECLEARLPPKGIFPFQVLRGQEKRSDKVGEFISLKLRLDIGQNKNRVIFDSLFFTDEMIWKTRHFYRSVNRLDIYESRKFMAQDCDNLKGFVEIDHRVRKDTGEIEAYVKDYISPEKPPESEDFIDDDIPSI